MFPSSVLNTIANALQALPGVNEGVKKQVISLVSSQLHKLDLVTREEFEVQCKTLEKTREIVAQLEQRVAALEQQQEKA